MKAITRARARHRRRLRICDDAHQSHVFLKEVVSTRFSLRRNKESVVVVVVVVVLLKKTKNIFLSFYLHQSSSHIKLVPFFSSFFSRRAKKKFNMQFDVFLNLRAFPHKSLKIKDEKGKKRFENK